MDKKYAVLSMDVEDWYHLDYFTGKTADKSASMMDGFTRYIELLNARKLKTTFFVLSELIDTAKEQILFAAASGHEIACHGKSHTRPLTMEKDLFEKELRAAKAELEDLTGKEVCGYRAPCYSIDNERYEIVKKTGFKYSSSRMDVAGHPLYGELDLTGYGQTLPGIYEKDGFFEFALSTQNFAGKHIAVSGGGWIRLFPWGCFMKPLIRSYLKNAQIYTLYIHPFELSEREMPKVPGTSAITNLRARKGLYKVEKKIEQLIDMLTAQNFEITTFSHIMERL